MTQPDAGESPDVLRPALDVSDERCRELAEHYGTSSSWGEAIIAVLAEEVLRLRRALAGRTQGEPVGYGIEWFGTSLENVFTHIFMQESTAVAYVAQHPDSRPVPLFRASPAPATPAGLEEL